VRLFAVVVLAVFLLVLGLLSRSTVRYTASVPVNLSPVLKAASGDSSQGRTTTAWAPLGKLVAPGGLLAQAIGESGFDAELHLGSSATRISALDTRGHASESRGHLTIETTDDQPDVLVISSTDPSREQAEASARLAAELIAHRFVELETETVSQYYERVREQASEARKKFAAADAKVDQLLANHFSKMRDDLNKSAGSIPPVSTADQLTTDEEQVGAPTVGQVGSPHDLTIAQLNTRLAQLERERMNLLAKLTPLHPVVRAVEDEIETVHQQITDLRDGKPVAPLAADDATVAPPGAVADEGGKVLPPWMKVGPPTPAESIPPPQAPPATVEAPIINPEEQPTVSLDASTAEGMESTIAVDTGALAKARAYLAESDDEYRTAKEARDAAHAEYTHLSKIERIDWLRVERLEQARPVLGSTHVDTTAPQRTTRRSIIGLAVASALVLGVAVAWGGAVASASFGSIAEVENLIGVPVVGVIETVDTSISRRRTKRIRTWTGRVGLVCELLLVAAIVWLAFLVASQPGFIESMLADPYETIVDAIW